MCIKKTFLKKVFPQHSLNNLWQHSKPSRIKGIVLKKTGTLRIMITFSLLALKQQIVVTTLAKHDLKGNIFLLDN